VRIDAAAKKRFGCGRRSVYGAAYSNWVPSSDTQIASSSVRIGADVSFGCPPARLALELVDGLQDSIAGSRPAGTPDTHEYFEVALKIGSTGLGFGKSAPDGSGKSGPVGIPTCFIISVSR
jgi:hypothetical protein